MKNEKKRVEEKTERTLTDRAFLKTVITSVISICICLFCLCGGTWAWFSATTTGATTSVQASEYNIAVVVEGTEVSVSGKTSSFTATAGTEYSVTLTASGTASTGFCLIAYRTTNAENAAVSGNLYTQQLPTTGETSEKTMQFTIRLANGGTVTFQPQWGSSGPADRITNDQSVNL